MEAIISTFHIDWKIIIAQAINFAVVFVVLYMFALKPLAVLILKRTEKIVKGIADAKENAKLVEESKAHYNKALEEAKREADKIFQTGKKEAEANKNSMLEEARVEAVNILNNGKKMLEAEKVKTVAEAKSEIVELAMMAAKKIMEDKNK